MPRAASPAANAAMPETAAPEPAAAPTTEEPPTPVWGNWLYTGQHQRIYTNVPVTVQPGDVIAWPGAPAADGWWKPTKAPVTRNPDNHRPEPTPADSPKEG